MVTPQIGSDGSVMLSLSPTLMLPTHDADGKRVGGSLGVVDMLARLTDGETIVVSGFGRCSTSVTPHRRSLTVARRMWGGSGRRC